MLLVVGRIGRAHGVRGDLFVEVRTDEPEMRFAVGSQLKTENDQSLTIASSKWHSGRLVVHFSGYDDRTSAESLRGIELSVDVDPSVLPDDPDEFYDHQLVGLSVKLESGEFVGTVTEVLHLPHQDHLAIIRPDESEVLVPFVTQFVPHVDISTGTLIITPPSGLLNEQEAIVVRSGEVEFDADI